MVRSERAQTQPYCIYVLIQVHIPADDYVDDVFVCVKVLKKLQEKYGIEKLAKLWDCDEELDEVLDYSYKKSLEILKKQNLVKQVLEY